ncbi:MAG: hypothetical protein HC838_09875 [Spirulinaceae cyanobacterium RM2_2_10]|nr:hypothetical protein [Spirulinaceae cyanobacterium RM2_2_10]
MSSFFKDKDGRTMHPDGWGIKFVGAEDCVYREGDKEVSFNFVLNAETDTFHFAAFTPGKWDEPQNEIPMTDKKWGEILGRLRSYLEYAGDWNPYLIED